MYLGPPPLLGTPIRGPLPTSALSPRPIEPWAHRALGPSSPGPIGPWAHGTLARDYVAQRLHSYGFTYLLICGLWA